MEFGFIHPYYNKKAAKLCLIFTFIAVAIMVVTVILQIFWFNIILHTILASVVLALTCGCIVCDIIQKDGKNTFMHGSWMLLWAANMILNLMNHLLL